MKLDHIDIVAERREFDGRRLQRLINAPLIVPTHCEICGGELGEIPAINLGIVTIPWRFHRECLEREQQRTKHLCRRPYQLSTRRPTR